MELVFPVEYTTGYNHSFTFLSLLCIYLFKESSRVCEFQERDIL
uniref:Uncharacterized protein n=1 Tax=Anguilla anguilla TaxID=7936 RepID=A0A0E9SYH7_ANGAN